MSERKAVIKNADMSEDMQQDAIDCATQVLLFVNLRCQALTKKQLRCKTLLLRMS